MTKLLFITLGHLSAGEFTIAFEFCKYLPINEFDICFLTSKKGLAYLKDNNIKHVCMEKSNEYLDANNKYQNITLFDDLMKEFRPDFIIASDIYTLWYSNSWTGLDLELMKKYGVKIGSFDSYEFASTDFNQDYYGGFKSILPDFIDKCDFVIRYCPLNKIKKSEAKIKYTYFFKEKIILSKKQRITFERKFKPNDEKVVFMTNSNWENLNVNRLPALAALIEWVPKIIINYLTQLNKKIVIIHIGNVSFESIIGNDNITYYHYPYIEAEKFDEYLSCSDLFLTTNIISSTLVKSIYANVPAVVLQNDKIINFSNFTSRLNKMSGWYRDMTNDIKIAYPYRLFPFGWYSFLKPLLENNDYLETFIQSCLFHSSRTINILNKYLFDQTAREELIQKQNSYINKLSKLDSPKEVINSLKNGGG
ncbi:MAG: DUF6365 family protein [Lachnospiraceae bacterium]|nr:DUF6365 family protein [Lachnospiraceae bacterium]